MPRQKRSKDRERTVLLIEDDPAIAEVLTYNLEREGYKTEWLRDGADGLRRASERKPDLIILDLMLPSLDGVEICRELRSDGTTRHVPILMLTAKSDEVDQVEGFSVGADDYVTKPFSVKVLLQRIRALLKRSRRTEEQADTVELFGVKLDVRGHEVSCEGKPISLTPTEYRLLKTMMDQPGRAFTRSDLMDSAIGDEAIVLERTIDVHIRSLRQKLGEYSRPIQTVRGVGYRFAREMGSS